MQNVLSLLLTLFFLSVFCLCLMFIASDLLGTFRLTVAMVVSSQLLLLLGVLLCSKLRIMQISSLDQYVSFSIVSLACTPPLVIFAPSHSLTPPLTLARSCSSSRSVSSYSPALFRFCHSLSYKVPNLRVN